MAPPVVGIRNWSWASVAKDQRSALFWGVGWILLYIGVLVVILMMAGAGQG